jgi:hypothetical protein
LSVSAPRDLNTPVEIGAEEQLEEENVYLKEVSEVKGFDETAAKRCSNMCYSGSSRQTDATVL